MLRLYTLAYKGYKASITASGYMPTISTTRQHTGPLWAYEAQIQQEEIREKELAFSVERVYHYYIESKQTTESKP